MREKPYAYLRQAIVQDNLSDLRYCVWIIDYGCSQTVLVYGKEKVSKKNFINLLLVILRGTCREIKMVPSSCINSLTVQSEKCVPSASGRMGSLRTINVRTAERFFYSLR